jgi:hypothetical protein
MNAEGIRGGTEETSFETEKAETARCNESCHADAPSMPEVRRSQDSTSRLPDVRDIS